MQIKQKMICLYTWNIAKTKCCFIKWFHPGHKQRWRHCAGTNNYSRRSLGIAHRDFKGRKWNPTRHTPNAVRRNIRNPTRRIIFLFSFHAISVPHDSYIESNIGILHTDVAKFFLPSCGKLTRHLHQKYSYIVSLTHWLGQFHVINETWSPIFLQFFFWFVTMLPFWRIDPHFYNWKIAFHKPSDQHWDRRNRFCL